MVSGFNYSRGAVDPNERCTFNSGALRTHLPRRNIDSTPSTLTRLPPAGELVVRGDVLGVGQEFPPVRVGRGALRTDHWHGRVPRMVRVILFGCTRVGGGAGRGVQDNFCFTLAQKADTDSLV